MARFNRLELSDDSPQVSQTGKKDIPDTPPEKRYRHSVADWMREASDFRRKGLYETALRAYGRAAECERSHVAAWVGQAQMLILLGEPRQAEMWTISSLKMFPNNAELLAARSQALCRLGSLREALQFNDAAIQGEGTSAYRWSVRGEVMTATKSPTASHCFDNAEQIDADWLVRTEHANILRFYKNPLQALGRATAATHKAPDVPFAWRIKGICEYESGFRAQALQSFERTLQLDPDSKEAKYWLATVQQDTGLLKRILNFFRRR